MTIHQRFIQILVIVFVNMGILDSMWGQFGFYLILFFFFFYFGLIVGMQNING